MGLLVVLLLSYGFMKLCRYIGNSIRDKKFVKTCPRCGANVVPEGNSVSNLYWKGTMTPVYHYKCNNCGHEFSNRPY